MVIKQKSSEPFERTPLSALGALLVHGHQSATGGNLAAVPECRFFWRRTIALAGAHRLTPALFGAISDHGPRRQLEPDLLEFLKAMSELNSKRNKMLIEQSKTIVSLLNSGSIEPVFLKGMALLLQGVYPSSACRFMRDIDLLLHPDQLAPASALLRSIGYCVLPDTPDDAHDAVKLVHPEEMAMVEIHQSPLPPNLDYLAPSWRVLQRKVQIAEFPGVAHAPNPTDLVVHNAAHAMLHDHHYRLAELPLKDAYDVALLSLHYRGQIDWTDVEMRMAESTGGAAVMAFYCNAIRSVFGIDSVPWQHNNFALSLTHWRWRRRGGQPLDMSAAHTGLRNLTDGGWRCLIARGDRTRIARSLMRPRRYQKYLLKLVEIASRQPGRFT